jgi:hypothetical protein
LQDLVPSFVGKAAKYGLDDLTYSSFSCSFGFKHRYCAVDMVHCIQVLLIFGQIRFVENGN